MLVEIYPKDECMYYSQSIICKISYVSFILIKAILQETSMDFEKQLYIIDPINLSQYTKEMDQDHEQQLLKQNLDSLDEIKIKVETHMSNKYSLYMQQMAPYMQRYTEDPVFVHNITTDNCSNCSSVENYLYFKRRKTIQLQTSDFFLEVTIINTTKCKDYVLTDIRYNSQTFINIPIFISADRSPFHENCTFSSGNFANVYKAKIKKYPVAVKCFIIKEQKSLSSQFMKILKEYMLFIVTSQQKIAPRQLAILNFRIMIYRNCIEFPMELCQEVLTYSPKMEDDIRQALAKMHKNHFIHFDIKPQNICFSPSMNKYVLIDFGLSEIIPQKLGETKILSFRGSLGYCSEEMKACSRLAFAEIDPYYNDLHCLNQSMKIFKKLNLNPNQQQSLPQINSYLKPLSASPFQLSFQSNKSYGNFIVKMIQTTDSLDQWKIMVQLLNKFQYSMSFRRIFGKQSIINKKFQSIGEEMEKLRDSEATIKQEQVIDIYHQIFQPEEKVQSQGYPQRYYVYTDILSICEKYDQKLIFIRGILQQNGIATTNYNDQAILREFYVKLLIKLQQQQMKQLRNAIQFAHFLPSFILFKIISAENIILIFQKCLLSFQKSLNQKREVKKWTQTIFKFLMAIQWTQNMIVENYHYDSISQIIFELLEQSIQRTPAKKVDYKTSQIQYIVLNLAVQYKRSSTNRDNFFHNRVLQQLWLTRSFATHAFQQIVEYLVCLMMKKIPFNFISQIYFSRKLVVFIQENKYHLHYKLYPYYINVFICLYQLQDNKQSWIEEKIKNCFTGFSFFRKTLFYYFHKQILLNFTELMSQIINIADEISEPLNKTIYIHRIVKMFLYNKYGAFITNETKLNHFVLTLGQSYNIFPYFLNRIFYCSQKQPHRSHEEYTTQIAVIFRYFIASIVSQNPLNLQRYILFHQKSCYPVQQKGFKKKLSQVQTNLNEKILDNNKILIYISLFINIFQQLPSPNCIICKIRYAVYLQLLKSIKLLYQGSQEFSLESFTRLIIYSYRQQQLKQFLTEALSVYFYFCSLKKVQDRNKAGMIYLAMQIVHSNTFQLYHIILCATELYIQIFKQTLIRFPNSAVSKLVLPTIQNVEFVTNTDFYQKMQQTFLRSLQSLKKQVSSQHFLYISQLHFSDLMSLTKLAFNKDSRALFELLGYVLAFMRHFILQFQKNIKLYKFISVALQNQPNKLKQFYIGRFYQVFRKKEESLRFSKFKGRMILKLMIFSKFDSNPLIRYIRMKIKKGDILQRKMFENFYKKMTKFALQNMILS